MIYVPLPISRIQIGQPLPVNVVDPRGNLLLRKGQIITSEHHREHLAAHQASAAEPDYKAWVRSYDRLIYRLLREDVSIDQIAKTPMPSTILEVDYATGYDITGGWLDMQAVMHGLLQNGAQAQSPLQRMEGVQRKAMQLLGADPDDALLSLFQALFDPLLGYCATHGLLCAVLCELTARKLEVAEIVRPVLFQAALTMNIGMAREQDLLTRQNATPNARQRRLIREHGQISADMLRGFGAVNEDLLDIVELHHSTDPAEGLARNLECRRILHAADIFVAKMAARANRVGLSAISAAKSSIIGAVGEDARVSAAMANVLGFYPPGTYVQLINGEKAISVKRGTAANTPLVVSIVNANGLALTPYLPRDTKDPRFAIQSPVSHETIRHTIPPERIARALLRLQTQG